MIHFHPLHPAFLLVALFALGSGTRAQSVTMVDPFPDLPLLSDMVELMDAGDGTNLLYYAGKRGRIRVFENRPDVSEASLFLDIDARVTSDGEGGLLGLAFDPGYAQNGYFYVDYTATRGTTLITRVSRFTRSPSNPLEADPASESVLLEVDQVSPTHNAGAIAFGPPEGPGGERYLYVSLGDGTCCGDPGEHGQDPSTLLGSILRLDVDGSGLALDCGAGTGSATVPVDNPFVGVPDHCDEIWAYGFRNPWRMRFDEGGDWSLWAGDVGQNRVEEVDIIEAGGNYGWDEYEGTVCFEGPCDPAGKTFPVYEYGHDLNHIAVVGGYVYRGSAIPELIGTYVYGDLAGPVYALDVSGGGAVNEFLLNLRDEGLCLGFYCLNSWGEDAAGELYLLATQGGIRKLVRNPPLANEPPPEVPTSLRVVGPNPTRDWALVRFMAEGPARLTLHDVLGRRVAVLYEGAWPWAPRETTVDTSALAPGVYVLRLEDGGAVTTRELTVVR
jgi:glucose/arabinose dehydrogenase